MSDLPPTAREIEAVVADMIAGVNTHIQFLETGELDGVFYWCDVIDPNGVESDRRYAGASRREAIATAWICEQLDELEPDLSDATDDDFQMVPRQVPPGWQFVIWVVWTAETDDEVTAIEHRWEKHLGREAEASEPTKPQGPRAAPAQAAEPHPHQRELEFVARKAHAHALCLRDTAEPAVFMCSHPTDEIQPTKLAAELGGSVEKAKTPELAPRRIPKAH